MKENKFEGMGMHEKPTTMELMRRYKKESDKCGYCGGGQIDGCVHCDAGRKIRSLANKASEKPGGWRRWELFWKWAQPKDDEAA